MSWIPAAIGAGAAIYGAVKGAQGQQGANRINLQIARETNQASAAMADRQMHFQRDMYAQALNDEGQAVQRKVIDMKAAGLNPMLAAGAGGAGVPSPPSGASASMTTGAPMQNENSHYAGLGGQIANIASSASGIEKQTAEISKVKAETLTALNQAGISSNDLIKSDALIDAMIEHGFSMSELPGDDGKPGGPGRGAMQAYMREVVIKPDVQAKAAAMASQLNEQKLQEFINMPAANATMAAVQMALRTYLATKSKEK